MHTLSNRISTVDSCDSPGGGDESSTEDNVASFLFLPDDNIIKRIDVCHVTRLLLLLYILYFCLFAILLSLSSSLFGIGLGSLLVSPLYYCIFRPGSSVRWLRLYGRDIRYIFGRENKEIKV